MTLIFDASVTTTDEFFVTSNPYSPPSGSVKTPFIYTFGAVPLTVNPAYSPKTYPPALMPETEYPAAESTATVYLIGS